MLTLCQQWHIGAPTVGVPLLHRNLDSHTCWHSTVHLVPHLWAPQPPCTETMQMFYFVMKQSKKLLHLGSRMSPKGSLHWRLGWWWASGKYMDSRGSNSICGLTQDKIIPGCHCWEVMEIWSGALLKEVGPRLWPWELCPVPGLSFSGSFHLCLLPGCHKVSSFRDILAS